MNEIIILHPIITYPCETLACIKGNKGKLVIFEKKNLRRIYGPAYNVDLEIFERRKSHEIERLYNKPGIFQFLRSKRIERRKHKAK